jgi:hypothetical protein
MLFPIASLYFTLPIFVISLLFLRKAIWSIFDPFLITLFALSSAIGLMLYYYVDADFADGEPVVMFLLAHVAFLVGVNLANRTRSRISGRGHFHLRGGFLNVALLVSLLSTIFVFVLISRTAGINVLQDDPNTSRSFIYQGWGVFPRILPVLITMSVAILFVSSHYRKRSVLMTLILLCIPLFVAFATAGRSSFLVVLLVVVYQRIFLAKNYGQAFTLKQRMSFGLMVAVALAAAVAFMMIGITRNSPLLPVDEILSRSASQIVDRVIGYGDIAVWYFPTNLYQTFTKSPPDYLMHMLSDLLGLLRIVPYQQPLGAQLVSEATGLANEGNVGPNAQVYFVGAIYFGAFLGILYSFLIGCLIGFLRRVILLSFNKTNFDMLAFILANIVIYSLPVDFSYTLTLTYAYFPVIVPVFAASAFAYVIGTGQSPVSLRITGAAPGRLVRTVRSLAAGTSH